jgi:hypothetical protein
LAVIDTERISDDSGNIMKNIDKIVGQMSALKLRYQLASLFTLVIKSSATRKEKSEISKEINESLDLCDVLEREIKFLQNHFRKSK